MFFHMFFHVSNFCIYNHIHVQLHTIYIRVCLCLFRAYLYRCITDPSAPLNTSRPSCGKKKNSPYVNKYEMVTTSHHRQTSFMVRRASDVLKLRLLICQHVSAKKAGRVAAAPVHRAAKRWRPSSIKYISTWEHHILDSGENYPYHLASLQGIVKSENTKVFPSFRRRARSGAGTGPKGPIWKTPTSKWCVLVGSQHTCPSDNFSTPWQPNTN